MKHNQLFGFEGFYKVKNTFYRLASQEKKFDQAFQIQAQALLSTEPIYLEVKLGPAFEPEPRLLPPLDPTTEGLRTFIDKFLG